MDHGRWWPFLLMMVVWFTGATTGQNGDSGAMVRVVSFNLDRVQRGNTWIDYGEEVAVREDYTLCLRFNLKVFRLLSSVIYLLDKSNYDNAPISFEVYFEKIRTKYGGMGRFYALPSNLATNKWYHYCQIRETSAGEGRVYLDGQMIIREKFPFKIDNSVRDTIIGQDEWLMKYSYSGWLTQVNIWGRVLTQEEIGALAGCHYDMEGDVMSWSGPWRHYDVKEEEIKLVELCTSVSRGRLTVPLPLLRYTDAVQVCLGLRGYIAVPTTRQQFLEEIGFFQDFVEGRWSKPKDSDDNTTLVATTAPVPSIYNGCERQWGGASDEAEEGVWYDPFHDRSYTPVEVYFHELNPDGGQYQNCLLLRYQGQGLLDTDCKKHCCTACHTTAGTTWTLRGTCEEEERMYYFDLAAVPLAFQGYGEYLVEQFGDMWVWYNTITNTTMATLSAQALNYPIGRLSWNIKEKVCEQESGQRVLTLSPCQVGEFTCTDGSCIPFAKRCDLKFDCKDKTDESFCDIVNYPGDYRSKLPPRPVTDLALPISLNISIDTLNIDTTTMLLSVSYNLRMTWYDNRLTYNNLKPLTRLNTVSQDQVELLWRPQVGFINTDDIEHTEVDKDAVTTVLRRDTNFIPDLSNAFEVEIYRGDANPVSTSRKYSTIFTCNFDLVLYPFDIQMCFMRLQILSASSEYLIFNATNSHVAYLGQKLLVEYGIGKIDLEVDDTKQYSEIRVQVELIRRYGYAMLNIYIPSLTLLTISFVTLFFRAPIFEVRVMTALTALLVLATLFTQVSASLPKTSYFKMVDIWLLFCIMLIFFIIIFHTIIDLQVDYNAPNSQSWVKQTSSSAGSSLVKVIPASGSIPVPPIPFVDKFFKMKFNLKFYILLSRYTMFLIFLVFNVAYWGTLAKDSGLVYYY